MTPETPAPETPAEPEQRTAAEAAEIAKAVVQAMAEADTRAEAETAAANTLERELKISDDDAKRIAKETIDELDRRGAFETPAAPAGEPPAEPVEPVTPAEPERGGQAEPQGSGADPGQPDPAPRKTTFAERFMGKT